jgi:hypothetical protein
MYNRLYYSPSSKEVKTTCVLAHMPLVVRGKKKRKKEITICKSIIRRNQCVDGKDGYKFLKDVNLSIFQEHTLLLHFRGGTYRLYMDFNISFKRSTLIDGEIRSSFLQWPNVGNRSKRDNLCGVDLMSQMNKPSRASKGEEN